MKKKFNALDIFIIVAVIIVCAAGIYVVRQFMNPAEEGTKTVVVEVNDKKESFCKILKKNDEVMDGVENVDLGTIIDFEVKPAETDSISTLDGVISRTTVPERFDIKMTIEIPQSTEVQVGKMLWLETDFYKCSGYILEINDGGKVAEER